MSRRGLFRDTSSGVIDDGLTPIGLATTSDLAGYQPLDSDLTAIAALTTTSFGRALLTLADAAALQSDAGLVIGTDVEAHDADLTTIAGLAPTNDDILQRKAGAWTNRTPAQLIADLAALGTTFQPLDSDLTAIAALSTTSYGRSLLTAADAAGARTLLGLGTAALSATGDFDAAGAAAAAQAASQPLDSDLTALAGLDSSTSGAIASDGAGWIKKTYAQFKTALSLVKADVGLGSVDNTADAAKNVATAAALTTARTIDGQSFDGTANITVIAPGTHAATSKTTPVDADELPLVDSAASNVLKKLTGTNLKAYLKTYFDTLYQATGSVSSVFTRTGAVVAASGDYTAAQVTNAADKSSASQQTFTGNISTPALIAAGLTGATAATRYVGGTTSGAPTSGTFAVGDFVVDQTGKVIVCVTAGTPGTWLVAPGGWSSTFDLVSSAATTNIMSQSIPANTLGANGGLLGVVVGSYLNNSGAARGMSLGVTFGGTNMWFDTSSATLFPASATAYPFYWAFFLENEGATNAQRVSGIVVIGTNTAGSTAGIGSFANGNFVDFAFTGTAAVDTTAAKTLAVRAAHSASNGSLELKGSVHVQVF